VADHRHEVALGNGIFFREECASYRGGDTEQWKVGCLDQFAAKLIGVARAGDGEVLPAVDRGACEVVLQFWKTWYLG